MATPTVTEAKPDVLVSLMIIVLGNGKTYYLVVVKQADLEKTLGKREPTTTEVMEEVARRGFPQVPPEDALTVADLISTGVMKLLGLQHLVVMQKVPMGDCDRLPGVGLDYEDERYRQTFNPLPGVVWERRTLDRGDCGFVFLAHEPESHGFFL